MYLGSRQPLATVQIVCLSTAALPATEAVLTGRRVYLRAQTLTHARAHLDGPVLPATLTSTSALQLRLFAHRDLASIQLEVITARLSTESFLTGPTSANAH